MQQMADDIVVIGKGKLIANTSMQALTSGSKHTGVFVRTSQTVKLEAALEKASVKYEKLDGGLKITGKKTDDIGKLAFKAGLPLLELANRSASLEDVFLELTEGAEEYGSKTEAKQ
jgi:ABC-2 type transport system ATP-binding protein